MIVLKDALPQDEAVLSRRDGVLDCVGCPSSLPCAVRFDPTCLEDTDEDEDKLVESNPRALSDGGQTVWSWR